MNNILNKICNNCDETFPLNLCRKGKNLCIECDKLIQKEKYNANKKARLAYRKKKYQEEKKKKRTEDIKLLYKMLELINDDHNIYTNLIKRVSKQIKV